MLIEVFVIFIGFLVLKKKAVFLINLVLWNGVTGDENVLARFFGTILIIAGLIIMMFYFIKKIQYIKNSHPNRSGYFYFSYLFGADTQQLLLQSKTTLQPLSSHSTYFTAHGKFTLVFFNVT